jgi:hypothetical protein
MLHFATSHRVSLDACEGGNRLVLNLAPRTLKTLGLTMPDTLLARADDSQSFRGLQDRIVWRERATLTSCDRSRDRHSGRERHHRHGHRPEGAAGEPDRYRRYAENFG